MKAMHTTWVVDDNPLRQDLRIQEPDDNTNIHSNLSN